MTRSWRRLATSLVAAALGFPSCSVAASPAPPDPHAAPDSTTASAAVEQRCDALADQFETRAAEVRERSGEEDLTLLEALEIAGVANELVAEGDVDTAASLFEEAIALLEPPEAAP